MVGRLVELLKHFQDRFLFEHFGFLLGNQTIRPHSSLLLAARQPPLARAWSARTHNADVQKKKRKKRLYSFSLQNLIAFKLQARKTKKKCQPRKSLAVGGAGGAGAGWAAGGAGETDGEVCAEAAGVCAGF